MDLRERIEALKVRGTVYRTPRELTAALSSDREFKNEIKEIYKLIFEKTLSGCSNCIADAYYRILNSKTENREQKTNRKFRLRAGAVLHDKNFNADKMASNVNITDELALYHLANKPDCVVYFSELPDNWQQMVEDYKNARSEIDKVPQT